MKDKIEKILAQKVKEDKELEKEFEDQNWLRHTDNNYTERKDKLETEIDLLNLLLKD